LSVAFGDKTKVKLYYNKIMAQTKKTDSVKKPTSEKISDEDILSVWANYEQSAQKIARDMRERNR
jgi:hypothetical protein